MAHKTPTKTNKQTTRQSAARRELQAEFAFERKLARLSLAAQRRIYGMLIGFWLLERPQYLEQVRQWVFEE